MKTKIKGNVVNFPFIGNSRDSIKRAKETVRKEYPNSKMKYIKSRFIKDKKFGDFWTYPEIRVEV